MSSTSRMASPGFRSDSAASGPGDIAATAIRLLVADERPVGAPAPVLPGTVQRIGTGACRNLVDLAWGEEFDLPHCHRLHLQLGVDFEIDRDEHRMSHGLTRDGRAMTAHQDGAVAAERAREIAPHLDVLD